MIGTSFHSTSPVCAKAQPKTPSTESTKQHHSSTNNNNVHQNTNQVTSIYQQTGSQQLSNTFGSGACGDNGENQRVAAKRKFEQEDRNCIKSPGRLARKRIRDAKHRARSELVSGDLFCNEQYYLRMDLEKFRTNFTNSIDQLPMEISRQMLEQRPYVVDRVDGRTLTELEFIERFEKPKIPVVFTHLIDDWPGYKENTKWSSLAWLDRKFRNQKFKCGEDDSGCSVKIKMKYYLQYLTSTYDDSPLYVFDSNYGEHPKRKKLLNDYKVPHLFQEDLFQHAGEGKRPPYRWFVMGPPRSGTGIHIDPLATSAWNSLIRGAKRWCLLPNEVPKHLIKPQATDNCSKQKDEAVTWFRYVHPRVTSPTWPAKWRPIEFIQLPGETVFVPGGWWHVVLNLDISIAMTQNYCNSGNFRYVWQKTAKGRPRFCHKWYRTLKKIGRDDLIAIAHEVSKNNPEHFPNLELCPSSSDSSSDTSTASSDSSESVELAEPAREASQPVHTANSTSSSSSTTTGSSSQSRELTVGNREESTSSDSNSEPGPAETAPQRRQGNGVGMKGENDRKNEDQVDQADVDNLSPDTSDDDSGMEEQDKKRRKVATTAN